MKTMLSKATKAKGSKSKKAVKTSKVAKSSGKTAKKSSKKTTKKTAKGVTSSKGRTSKNRSSSSYSVTAQSSAAAESSSTSGAASSDSQSVAADSSASSIASNSAAAQTATIVNNVDGNTASSENVQGIAAVVSGSAFVPSNGGASAPVAGVSGSTPSDFHRGTSARRNSVSIQSGGASQTVSTFGGFGGQGKKSISGSFRTSFGSLSGGKRGRARNVNIQIDQLAVVGRTNKALITTNAAKSKYSQSYGAF
jgi:hypothetical protein